MTLYCQITNGVIGQPQSLPETFSGISNFFAVDPVLLPSFGWLPFVPAEKPAYAETTQKLVQSLELVNNQVVESWQVVSMTPEEQAAFATARLTEIGNQIGPFLDAQVQVRQYDTIISAASWSLSNITIYKSEAEQAAAYRDGVWQQFGTLVEGVQAGNTPLPTANGWFAGLAPLWSNGTTS